MTASPTQIPQDVLTRANCTQEEYLILYGTPKAVSDNGPGALVPGVATFVALANIAMWPLAFWLLMLRPEMPLAPATETFLSAATVVAAIVSIFGGRIVDAFGDPDRGGWLYMGVMAIQMVVFSLPALLVAPIGALVLLTQFIQVNAGQLGFLSDEMILALLLIYPGVWFLGHKA